MLSLQMCLSIALRSLARSLNKKDLKRKIFDKIIDEETIADNASSELYDIRRALNQSSNKVRDILQSIITNPGYQNALQEQIITMRGDRYVVPVKSECKGSINGLIHDVSSSGATVFIEPMQVVQLNNEIRELIAKEKKEIALMKATGMTNGKIYAYHTLRFVFVGVVAILLGWILALPMTHLCIDPVFKMMGMELAVNYHINPLEMFLIYPAIVLATTTLRAFLT